MRENALFDLDSYNEAYKLVFIYLRRIPYYNFCDMFLKYEKYLNEQDKECLLYNRINEIDFYGKFKGKVYELNITFINKYYSKLQLCRKNILLYLVKLLLVKLSNKNKELKDVIRIIYKNYKKINF